MPLPPRLEGSPSVSVIRPIKSLGQEVDQNIRGGLDTGYPDEVQTIFVFDGLWFAAGRLFGASPHINHSLLVIDRKLGRPPG